MVKGLWYLAGPMGGIEDFNYPEFFRAANAYRKQGYQVVNPAEAFDGDTTLPYSTYIKRMLADIQKCSGLILLEGWEESKGANLEKHIADTLGFECILDEERCPRCRRQGRKDADQWWCLDHGEYGKDRGVTDPVIPSLPYRNRLQNWDDAEEAKLLRMAGSYSFEAIARELRRSVESVKDKYREITQGMSV